MFITLCINDYIREIAYKHEATCMDVIAAGGDRLLLNPNLLFFHCKGFAILLDPPFTQYSKLFLPAL